MNYLNKYNKYSSKLIKLNNNYFKGGDPLLRIRKEIELMSKNGYTHFNLDEINLVLTFTRISDNFNFKVKFPDNYPFSPPIINNGLINVNPWGPTLNIYKIITVAENFYDKKVLILCHGNKYGKVTGSFEPLIIKDHWYYRPLPNSIFEQLFTKYNLKGKPIFETVDCANINPTYQADAFSDKFIDKHIGEYDMVMVPDCDGQWAKLQLNFIPIDMERKERDLSIDEQNANKEILITLCLNLTRILKPNGIIQFGKFLGEDKNFQFHFAGPDEVTLPCNINGKDFDNFSSALNYYLNKNGFVSEKIIIKDKKEEYIFITAQKR
jgi:hypothetical protein